MKPIRGIGLGGAMLALLAGQAQAATPAACITPQEVESIALVLLPDIVRGLGESCAAHLPETALLSRRETPMLARYDAEVDTAWPSAKGALLKMSGAAKTKEVEALMDVKFGRTFLAAFVVPGLTSKIKPAECPTVNHMIEMLEPLPPRNAAGLFAAILQLADADKKDADNDRLPLCPLGEAG